MARLTIPTEELERVLNGRVISFGAYAAKRVYKRDQGKFIGIGWTGRYYPYRIAGSIEVRSSDQQEFIVLDSQL